MPFLPPNQQRQSTEGTVRYTQVILFIWRVLHSEDKRLRRMGCMTQSTIVPVALPEMFTDFKNSFNSKLNDIFVMT